MERRGNDGNFPKGRGEEGRKKDPPSGEKKGRRASSLWRREEGDYDSLLSRGKKKGG